MKYKKFHSKRYSPLHKENRSFNLKFGLVGLKCMEYSRITARQLEAVRRVIRRGITKTGQIKINTFPSFSITKKAIGARMGKGKGKHHLWISHLYPGKILYELSQISLKFTSFRHRYIYALSKSLVKLPVKTKIVFLKY